MSIRYKVCNTVKKSADQKILIAIGNVQLVTIYLMLAAMSLQQNNND